MTTACFHILLWPGCQQRAVLSAVAGLSVGVTSGGQCSPQHLDMQWMALLTSSCSLVTAIMVSKSSCLFSST